MHKGKIIVLPSPFFPGIFLSRKPPETQGNGRFLKRTMVEKNGESTLRRMVWVPVISLPRPNFYPHGSGSNPVLGCMRVCPKSGVALLDVQSHLWARGSVSQASSLRELLQSVNFKPFDLKREPTS